MKKGKRLQTIMTYAVINPLNFSEPIKEGFRCSIWFNDSDFTAAEWAEIEGGMLLPGESRLVEMNVLHTSLVDKIKVGDIIFWGGGYKTVGSCEVTKIY